MNKLVSHGIEPELPQDGVETVPVRRVSAEPLGCSHIV